MDLLTSNSQFAFIIGITSKDGSYLVERLLEKGCECQGIETRILLLNTCCSVHVYQFPHDSDQRFILHHGDLTDSTSLVRILQQVQPDELYNLAAQRHLAVSFEMPEYTVNSDALNGSCHNSCHGRSCWRPARSDGSNCGGPSRSERFCGPYA